MIILYSKTLASKGRRMDTFPLRKVIVTLIVLHCLTNGIYSNPINIRPLNDDASPSVSPTNPIVPLGKDAGGSTERPSPTYCEVLSIAPSTVNLNVSGGSTSIQVTSQDDCTNWAYDNSESWITVTKYNKSLRISVGANSLPSGRKGTVDIGGFTVTVNQAGTCVTPTSYPVNGGGDYCSGGSGVAVGLSGSQSGVSYQLKLNGSPIGSAVQGTGGAIGFGSQTSAGTYTVLATNTSGGCTADMSGSASVTIKPVPSTITGVTSLCAGSSTALYNATSGGAWSSSNTAVATVGSSGLVIGVAAGTSVISYTLANGCTPASTTVTVKPLPVASIAVTESSGLYSNDGTICKGSSVTLSYSGGTPGVTYSWWDLVHESPAGNAGSPTTLSPYESMNISLSVTKDGCTTRANQPITVNSPPPAAGDISGPSPMCQGSSATYTVPSIPDASTYLWVLPSGESVSTTTNSLSVNYSAAAVSGSITVRGGNSCGYGPTSTRAITINSLPTPISGVSSVCAGTTAIMKNAVAGGVWSSSNPAVATISESGLITGIAPGSVVISYVLTNGCGSASRAITVNALPTASITVTDDSGLSPNDGIICAGASATLTASGGTSYAWLSGQTTNEITVRPTSQSGYGVRVTDANGCTSSASRTITVNPMPAPIEGVTSICPGSSIALNNAVSGGGWSSSNLAVATVSPSGVVTGVAGGTTTISYAMPMGCGPTTASLTVNSPPASFNITGDRCASDGKGVPVGLSGSQVGVSYQLKLNGNPIGSAIPGTGAAISFGYQTVLGTYTASGTNGCGAQMGGTATLVENPLPGVYISEYVEGSGYNKAVEITNASAQPVDLGLLTLQKDLNGNAIYGNSLGLSGTLLPGASYVVANNKASAALLQKANAVYSSVVMEFNGDDQLRLVYGGVAIDAVGKPGGGNFGKDVTLIRSRGLNGDYLQNEWIPFPSDYFLNLGHHTDIQATHGVFISEYVEGSGQNKAFEVFNGTPQPVDLQGFALQKDQDGDGLFGEALPLSGAIQPKGVLVVVNSSASSDLLTRANVTTNTSTLMFNGNDQIRLLYNGVEVDRIGKPGNVAFGERKTLVRYAQVRDGAPGAAGFDTQWAAYPCDDFSHLGWHELKYPYSAPALSNLNYIYTVTPSTPIKSLSELSEKFIGDVSEQVGYFDGLGRPSQSISIRSTPALNDMVQPIKYDSYGKETEKYLPFEGSGGYGAFRNESGWSVEQPQFYNNYFVGEGNYAKSKIEYENSPLNRVVTQRGAGRDWALEYNNLEDKVTTFSYASNGNDVRYFYVLDDNNLNVGENYPIGTLSLLETIDEDKRVVQEYKDLAGQVVLKRTYTGVNNEEKVETYYAYDELGRLRYVLPPMMVENLSSLPIGPTDPLVTSYGYYYLYDERGRNIEKQIPGASTMYMVYDNLDRLVLEQDGELRDKSQWIAHSYDALGRELKSGIVSLGVENTQAAALVWFNANTDNIDAKINSGTLLVQSWYDTYDGLPTGFESIAYTKRDNLSMPDSPSVRIRGLVTAQEVRVLNPEVNRPATLKSKTFYDKDGRVLQTISQSYEGGYLYQSYRYDWSGKVLNEEVRIDQPVSVTLERANLYDHAGRVTLIQQRIDGGAWVNVASNDYDALGKNTTRRLGPSGSSCVQELNYKYNIRGWLTAINNPDALGTDLFAMRLNYQNQTINVGGEDINSQYGGNITETDWAYRDAAPGNIKRMAYRYWYDGLNRFTDSRWYSNSTSGWTREGNKYDTKYTYDKNGNIKTLIRSGVLGAGNDQIDNLVYEYSGNQLQHVTDNSLKAEGYRDLNKTGNDFTYNANGSMVNDKDKGINVTYNLLNLPQRVKESIGNYEVNYVYNASGAKLAALYVNGGNLVSGNRYAGPVVLRYDNSTSAWKPDYITTSEGRVSFSGNIWKQQYFLTDHLGNIRSIAEKSSTYTPETGWALQLWQQDYYPFGMTLGIPYKGTVNQLGYNGKENQDFELNGRSLELLDFGKRFYSPHIGRFREVDPIAEKYNWVTTYNYAENEPIANIDLWGLQKYSFQNHYMAQQDLFGAMGSYLYDFFSDGMGLGRFVRGCMDNAQNNYEYTKGYGIYNENVPEDIQNRAYQNIDNNTKNEALDGVGTFGMTTMSFSSILEGFAASSAEFTIPNTIRRPTLYGVESSKGGSFGEKLFLSEKFGITSEKFGSSLVKAQGSLNQPGGLFKMGWSNVAKNGGGMQMRIGIGSKAANPNQALFHMYVPKTFVPNSFANPSMQVKLSLYKLGL